MDFSIIRSFNNRKFYSLTPEKIYNVPPKATHVHIYNGYIAFGESKDKSLPVLKIKKTKRGRFVRIPPGISSIQFPKYFSAPEGHHYGPISFNPDSPEPPNKAA